MPFTDFDEEAGSPQFEFRIDRQSATRVGFVPWNKITSLVNTVFPIGAAPHALPGFPWMRATSIHVEPIVRDKTKIDTPVSTDESLDVNNTYDTAKVKISYEVSAAHHEEDSVGGEGPSDPIILLKHHWSIGGEFLTLPSNGLEWCTEEDAKDDVSAGILVPTIEHRITWPRVEKPPFTAIRNSIGRVNDDELEFRTGTILPETLLFLGAEMERDIASTGALAWEMNYHFSERRVEVADNGCSPAGVTGDTTTGGWNHFYRSDDEDDDVSTPRVGWYRLQRKYISGVQGSGGPIYEEVDFSQLFVEET